LYDANSPECSGLKLLGSGLLWPVEQHDHSTDAVRFLQIQYLFNGLADKISKYPIYLTGDFNATPNSSIYMEATTTLKDAGVTAKLNTSTISYTFDSYGTKNPGSRIDYCFYNDRSTALWYKVLNEKFNGYVSDHYGIIAEFVIK
jgi:endonuclease/exonuclease/phosphatase family metal-dependent hydrolase